MTRNTAPWLLTLASLAGCASGHPAAAPAPGNHPIADGGITLRNDWRATAIVEREDSIVLTLPSGDHQLQRFDRRAGFTLAVDANGAVSIRLDSLTFKPHTAQDGGIPIGATWTGQVSDVRIDALHVHEGGDLAADITVLVRDLLPRFPANGVRPRSAWTDSAAGDTRVDIFHANERRTAAWSAGALADRGGGETMAVQVREEFEQVGDGSQDGQRMTMTSQGRRSGIYYVTSDGRLSSAQVNDSVAMLISIPATKQMVPTMRYARTTVRYLPVPRGPSD